MGTLVVLSSLSWPIAWLGLELNLICFVPLMISREHSKKGAIIYFLVQRIGSLIILRGGLYIHWNRCFVAVIVAGLILKLGAVPVQFWVPYVVTQLSKPGIYVMLSWQKIAPFRVLVNLRVEIKVLALVNACLGALVIMTVSYPILVVVFSGITHIGWMMSINGAVFWNYIIIYFIILLSLIVFMKRNCLNFSLSLINAGGIPPFSGFAIKIKAVLMLEIGIGIALLITRALALTSYARLIVHTKSASAKRVWQPAALFVGII